MNTMLQNATSQAPMAVLLKHSLFKVCQVLLWIPNITRKEPFICFKKDRKICYHIKKKRIHDGFCKKEFRAGSGWFSDEALPVGMEDLKRISECEQMKENIERARSYQKMLH